jgi:hypothetical protein
MSTLQFPWRLCMVIVGLSWPGLPLLALSVPCSEPESCSNSCGFCQFDSSDSYYKKCPWFSDSRRCTPPYYNGVPRRCEEDVATCPGSLVFYLSQYDCQSSGEPMGSIPCARQYLSAASATPGSLCNP